MDPQPLISKSVSHMPFLIYPLELGTFYANHVLMLENFGQNKKKFKFLHRKRKFCDKKLFDKIL